MLRRTKGFALMLTGSLFVAAAAFAGHSFMCCTIPMGNQHRDWNCCCVCKSMIRAGLKGKGSPHRLFYPATGCHWL
jgi:hypothetical protein